MKITSSEYITTGTREEHFPIHNQNEYVLLGRSNVGKSSFINAFLNKKNLAYTSSKPGKTQALSFFHINKNFFFVDVPGYGYAKVSKKQREEFGIMIESYLTTRKNLKAAILLIDSRHDPSEDDILMYDFLKYYNIKCIIIATKTDKVRKTLLNQHIKNVEEKLNIEDDDILIPISSETKKGFDIVHKELERLEA